MVSNWARNDLIYFSYLLYLFLPMGWYEKKEEGSMTFIVSLSSSFFLLCVVYACYSTTCPWFGLWILAKMSGFLPCSSLSVFWSLVSWSLLCCVYVVWAVAVTWRLLLFFPCFRRYGMCRIGLFRMASWSVSWSSLGRIAIF